MGQFGSEMKCPEAYFASQYPVLKETMPSRMHTHAAFPY